MGKARNIADLLNSSGKIDSADIDSSAQFYQFKNRIINGDCRLDQRNAGALVAGAVGNIFAVDRFPTGVFGSGTGRISAQQSNVVPTNAGFVKSVINTVTTADASPSQYFGYCFQQKIEGYNIADLGWGTANAATVTLSFWVRSSLPGTYLVTFSNENEDRAYSATYTISAANTWEQKTITVAGDTTGTWYTTNNTGIHLMWGLGGGTGRQAPSTNAWNTGTVGGYAVTDAPGCVDWIATNGATFYITGVQLEKGSTATSFDYRPYGTELALCQRYCFNLRSSESSSTYYTYGFGNNLATTRCDVGIPIPVTMRATPSLTTTGTASNYAVYEAVGVVTCSVVPALGGGSSIGTLQVTATTSGTLTAGRGASLISANNNTSYLLLTAEL